MGVKIGLKEQIQELEKTVGRKVYRVFRSKVTNKLYIQIPEKDELQFDAPVEPQEGDFMVCRSECIGGSGARLVYEDVGLEIARLENPNFGKEEAEMQKATKKNNPKVISEEEDE